MTYPETVIQTVKDRYPHEPEFVQAIEEMLGSLGEFLGKNPQYEAHKVLERLVEPDRVISFRVTWLDDQQTVQVNRGYRVQFSSVLGPYKGGLRFHPSVNAGILKFLAFEQIFKDSLTGLWLGGAKGGSDFDPKGKSDTEIMRFCQAFMTELYNYIDPDTDVPAGDIGVGGREIGYLFGWYKKLAAGKFHGSLTGKGTEWGGSNLRTEATGYGLLYFVEAMLKEAGQKLEGKRVVISGSGNVAQYAAEKSLEMGATVLTLSDSSGFIHDPEGITAEKLTFVKQLKAGGGRIKEYVSKYSGSQYHEGKRPWSVAADIYLPCATQNEIETADAKAIAAHKPLVIAEGANMPTTPEALAILRKAGILFAPAKAANAGGVAVSGLEMSQNMTRLSLSHAEIDTQLRRIMTDIHAKCAHHGKQPDGTIDYARGANIAGFIRVADALIAQGAV